MEKLFYALTFIFIALEIKHLINPQFYLDLSKDIKEINKKDKEQKKEILSRDGCLFELLYMCWAFVGLFSSQVYFFIVLFILSFFPKKSILLRRLDSIVSIMLLLTMFIVKYHLYKYFNL